MRTIQSLILCLVLLCGAAVLTAHTPQWQWAVSAGGTWSNRGDGIALDAAGNAYVTGRFQKTATFGSHTLTANIYSSEVDFYDVFTAKLDKDGNWLWAVMAGGDYDDVGLNIALDGNGNAYVNGTFSGTATFGNHALTAGTGVGYVKSFFAKLIDVTPIDDLVPHAVARLHNAWPNPVGRGDSAQIKAEISEQSSGTLSIFNQRGQRIAHHKLGSGLHQISFSGNDLPAGIYLYSLQCGDFKETKRLVLLK